MTSAGMVAVVGCADIVPPDGVLVQRHRPHDATISCRAAAVTRSWNVTCQDARWVVAGARLHLSSLLDNCSQPLPGRRPARLPILTYTSTAASAGSAAISRVSLPDVVHSPLTCISSVFPK